MNLILNLLKKSFKQLFKKAAYTTFTDSTLQSLNVILTGFNATQLSSFTITSDNTISVLGAISSWSSAQVIKIYFNIKLIFTNCENVTD